MTRKRIGLLAVVMTCYFGGAASAQVADDCALAPQIVNLPATFSVTNAGATPSVGLPCGLSSGGSATDPDVWFHVNAAVDGNLVISHDFNPMSHAVYIGTPGQCPLPASEIYCDLPSNQNGSITPVLAGKSYFVRCGDNDIHTANFTVDIVPTPANNDCDDPELIPALPATVSFDLAGATAATPTLSGAPCVTTSAITRDVWFEFTASASGTVGLTLTDFANLMIYDRTAAGVCPLDTDLINNGPNDPCDTGNNFTFLVTGGNTYLIRVGTPGSGAPAGDMSLVLVTGAPSNNNWDAPITLTVGVPEAYDTLGADAALNTSLQCQYLDTLWYIITAPADGRFHIQMPGRTGSFFNYPGAGVVPTNFDLVAGAECFNDINSCFPPVTCFGGRTAAVIGGQQYLLRMGGNQFAGGSSSGNVVIDYYPTPANDECANAETLVIQPPVSVNVSTIGANPPVCSQPSHFTPGCPENCGNTVRSDVWYKFTAPATGIVRMDWVGVVAPFVPTVIMYDTSLSLGCPTTADGKICVGVGDNFEEPVVAGVEYLVRLFFQNSSPGLNGTMTLGMLGVALNDDCTSPDPVSMPTTTPVAWDTAGGTDDTHGYSCFGRKDLWYSFTAPSTGQCEVEVSNGDARITAFHAPGGPGVCPADSDELECFSCASIFGNQCNPSFFDFPIVSGETYMLRVGGNNTTAIQGDFQLRFTNAPPANVVCDASVTGQITASYDVPTGSNYDLGVEVTVDGNIVATIPQTQTSYVHTLPPLFVGTVDIGFSGLSATLAQTDEVTCEAALGGPSNDLCTGAIPVSTGSIAFDTTITVLDPNVPLGGCTSTFSPPGHDLWFEFIAPNTELYTASTCTTPWDDIIQVWDGTGGCPTAGETDIDCGVGTFGCDISWQATMGQTYYIRVMGRDGAFGAGSLDIVADCAALTGLSAAYDCASGDVVLTWDGGSHINYDVTSDNQGFVANITTNTITFSQEMPGHRSYDVVGYCPNGSFLGATVDVFVADVNNPGNELLFALEGIENNGVTGDIDSALALENALTLAGRNVSVLYIEDFDQFPCLSTFTAAAENIWVVLGTFPWDYTLSTAEGDVLAGLAAAGKGIYLEGGQHWAGFHNPSLLDDRDGVEPAEPFQNVAGGDDSLTLMDGLDSGLPGGDLSAYDLITYNQDSIGNDLTDQLVVSGTDPVNYPPDPDTSAGALFVNLSDTSPPELPYVVAVHAVNNVDNGVMISSSFEFGGFGGDQDILVGQYLGMFGVAPTLEMFKRGDVNADGAINIADAVYLLGNLFPIGAPNVLVCNESADANNDGAINIADAVAILSALFGSPAQPLAAPYPNCGVETQSPNQTGIGCAMGTPCP